MIRERPRRHQRTTQEKVLKTLPLVMLRLPSTVLPMALTAWLRQLLWQSHPMTLRNWRRLPASLAAPKGKRRACQRGLDGLCLLQARGSQQHGTTWLLLRMSYPSRRGMF